MSISQTNEQRPCLSPYHHHSCLPRSYPSPVPNLPPHPQHPHSCSPTPVLLHLLWMPLPLLNKMSFLSSTHTPSAMSTPSSPLCQRHVFPLFFPTNVAYLLYAAVIDTPHLLHALEDDPLYQDDTITHKLNHLFHGISQAQQLLSAETTKFPLHFTLDVLPNCILSILHTYGFATFIEQIPPTTIYPTFQCIYFSLPQDQCNSYIEQLEQFLLHCPRSHSPVSVLPPLTSRLYSPPPADTPMAVESDNDSDKSYEQTIPISTNHPQTFTLDNRRNILSSPFHILPQPDQLHIPLATSNTTCFQCHGNSHYWEDCPDYICPHCCIANPSHPSHLCLTIQCDFCHNWGHMAANCPHRNCGVCSTPGHIVDNCLFEHLSPSQAAAIYERTSASSTWFLHRARVAHRIWDSIVWRG